MGCIIGASGKWGERGHTETEITTKDTPYRESVTNNRVEANTGHFEEDIFTERNVAP